VHLNEAFEQLSEQHGLSLATKKCEIHKALNFVPHFDILFADARLGKINFSELFKEVLANTDGGFRKWKFHSRPLRILHLASYFMHTVEAVEHVEV